jgi:NADH:ubiquinone oxidoreductase subunit 3 (subunit A)
MASTLNAYLILLSAALIALALPAFLWLASRSLRHSGDSTERSRPLSQVSFPSDQTRLGLKLNSRFFLATSAALLLIALGLLVIPVSVTLRADETREVVEKGLIAILSVALIAGLGLFYAEKKGDLNWMKTFK